MDSKNPGVPTRQPPAADHAEAMLDEALKATFPASDPIAINIQTAKGT